MALRGNMGDEMHDSLMFIASMVEATFTGRRIQFIVPKGHRSGTVREWNKRLLEAANQYERSCRDNLD